MKWCLVILAVLICGSCGELQTSDAKVAYSIQSASMFQQANEAAMAGASLEH